VGGYFFGVLSVYSSFWGLCEVDDILISRIRLGKGGKGKGRDGG